MLYNLVHISILVSSIAFYSGYLLLDDKTPEEDPRNKWIELIWHAVGAGVFVLLAYTFCRFIGWKYAFFVLAQFWLLFAGVIHTRALKKPFFFVGTTAITDRMLQWGARITGQRATTLSAVLKLTALLLSILIVIK